MDTATLAGMAVAALAPLVAKGVEEITKTVFKDTYTTIKERLSKKPESKEVGDKFEQNPIERAPEFQAALADQLVTDTELAIMLADTLEKSGSTEPGLLVGEINAEKVVVASKIDNVNM